MALVVNNNISSLMAQRNLSANTSGLSKSLERLSTGYKINRASDDAAGLSISESLRGQIRGNDQALKNTQDGVSMLQIAEGSLSVINENLQRIRELCVQAANDTNGTSEKQAILIEINQRLKDITQVAKTSTFNKISLLNATSSTSAVQLQVGANSTVSTNVLNIRAALPNSKATTLGISLNVAAATWTSTNIRSYIDKIDTALSTIQTSRSTLGAFQNRLDSSLQNMGVMNDSLRATVSRIRDTDIAKETSTMTKYQILQQASVSVLSQANQIPNLALTLLRG